MCQEQENSSNDRISLGTVSVPVDSKPHTLLPVLMRCQGYFELGIGDISSEYKVSGKQLQISVGSYLLLAYYLLGLSVELPVI